MAGSAPLRPTQPTVSPVQFVVVAVRTNIGPVQELLPAPNPPESRRTPEKSPASSETRTIAEERFHTVPAPARFGNSSVRFWRWLCVSNECSETVVPASTRLVCESNVTRPWLACGSSPGQPPSIRVSTRKRSSEMRLPNLKRARRFQSAPTPVVLPQTCSSAGLPSVRSNAKPLRLLLFFPATVRSARASR